MLVGAVLPVLVAGVSGNLSIPHNDAWAYSRIAATFGEDGRFELVGFNRSGLIGQIIVLGPLARFLIAQQLFVALMSALLLIAVAELLRSRIGDIPAGLAALGVAIWPGYALLSTSFMADVPMISASFLALWAADRALRRDSRVLLLFAFLLAFWACTIRAQAIAALVAVAIVSLLQRKSLTRIRPWFVIASFVAAGICFGLFTLWYESLPGGDPASSKILPDAISAVVMGAVRSWFTIALVAGPIALAFSRPWRWGRRGWTAAASVAVIAIVHLSTSDMNFFFPGNYIDRFGPYAGVLGPLKSVFGVGTWELLLVFAAAMGVFLAGACAESEGRVGQLLTTFSVLTILGTAAQLATPQGLFDRYLIPIVPFVIALAVSQRNGQDRPAEPRLVKRIAAVASVSAMTTVFLFSSAVSSSAWAFDRARWTVAENEVGRGIPADRIDAGLEWLGWHSADGVIKRYPTGGWGWQEVFSPTPSCVVLLPFTKDAATGGVPTDWVFEREFTYDRFLFTGGPAQISVFGTGASGC